jgi:hypothetical protein
VQAICHEDECILAWKVLPAWGRRKPIDIQRRDVITLLDDTNDRATPI